ncbi:MAG TPA: T9SS type A sorting domain-containing protein [Flavipsychrobacter sp.]
MKLRHLVFLLCIVSSTPAVAQCTGFSVSVNRNTDTMCVGDFLYLSPNLSHPGSSVNWRLPNGNLTGTSSIFKIASPTDTGWYTVIADNGTCKDSARYRVRIGEHLYLNAFNSNTPICRKETVTLQIVPPYSFTGMIYEFRDPGNGRLAAGTSDTYTLPNVQAQTADYTAYFYDSIGCKSHPATRYIVVYNDTVPPVPSATTNSPVCDKGDLKFSGISPGTPDYGFRWSAWSGAVYHKQHLTIPQSFSTQPGVYPYILQIANGYCISAPFHIDFVIAVPTAPAVSVSAYPGLNVGPYTPINFTALVANEGPNTTYQWYRNSTAIPGGTNRTIILATVSDVQAGDKIFVKVNTDPPCATINTATSPEVTVGVNVGIPEVDTETLVFYPNPVNDILTVQGIDLGADVVVYNTSGIRMLLPMQTDKTEVVLETSTLPAGLYILRNGSKTIRFVKVN